MSASDVWFDLTLLSVAFVATVMTAQAVARIARTAAWAIPTAVGIAFVVGDLFFSQSGSWQRYLSTVAVFVAAFATQATRRTGEIRAIRLTSGALAGYLVLGSVVGRLARGTVSGALPIGLPMLTSLVSPSRVDQSRESLRGGLTLISWAALAYSVAMWLTRSGVLVTDSLAYGHEKAFISVLGASCAVGSRRPVLLIAHAVAYIGAYLAYPAATFVVCLLAGALTHFVFWLRPGLASRRALALATGAAAAAALFRLDDIIDISSKYFAQVGKSDNGAVRRSLADIAFSRISENPIFSDFFTGELSVRTDLSGKHAMIPFHNDYLTLAVGGGLAAASAYIGIIILLNGAALRAVRTCRDASDGEAIASAITPFIACVNAAAAASFANPVLLNPQAGAIIWAAALAAISLAAHAFSSRPSRQGVPADSEDGTCDGRDVADPRVGR